MTVYSYAYSSHYYPSGPVVEAAVRGDKSEGTTINLTTLIDSGADATMLPISILRAAGARYIRTSNILGVTGARVSVDLYQVTIHVGGHTIPGVQVVAMTNNEDAILGRDILNHLVVTLDGPAGMTMIAA